MLNEQAMNNWSPCGCRPCQLWVESYIFYIHNAEDDWQYARSRLSSLPKNHPIRGAMESGLLGTRRDKDLAILRRLHTFMEVQ